MKRLLLLALGCLACAGDEPATQDEATLPADSLVVVTSIGGVDDERPEYEFGGIMGLQPLPDGGAAVVDGVNHIIRVYDDAGIHRFSFGRQGAGPGELERPCCPALDAQGRLWIRDGNSRFNVYSIAGDSAAYLWQVRMAHGDVNRRVPTTFDAEGNLIDVGARSDSAGRNTLRFHVDSAGNVLRQVILHNVPDDSTGMKSVQRPVEGGTVTMFFYQPHGPSTLFAHSPTGEFAHALSSRYAIDWRAPDGSLIRHLTHDLAQGAPLSAREDSIAEAGLTDNAERTGMSRAQLGFDVPSHKPPVAWLMFDADGRLWVQLSTADGAPRQAHVYARDGGLQRTVTWPADVRLEAMQGDVAWGVRTDSLGVASVVRLTRSGN